MNYTPIARIILRYVVAGILGAESAEILAGDVDVVAVVALGIGVLVEAFYALATRKGWAT